jgi:5'-nucleotidase
VKLPSQLQLPIFDPTQGTRVPRAQRIHVNRNLRLDATRWVGFDMDYTLAIYRHPEMDRLSIDATVAKMVGRFGRPESLLSMPVRADFPIRGLHVDKHLGNVLKMDRYRYVKRAYHGMRELDKDERRRVYHSSLVRAGTKRYHWVDTLYALPEVTVYSAAIEHLEERGEPIDYAKLFDEVRECIDLAHQDGSIADVIARDPGAFIERDLNLRDALLGLREAGKKLFLLTNSRPEYTRKILSFLLDDPTHTALELFDLVVCTAKKPGFFMDATREFEHEDGTPVAPSEPLLPGRLYQGGCLRALEARLGVTGDQILYVGDHIYGDVLRAKKETAWRTMMVVQEMSAELQAHDSVLESLERIDHLHRLCETLGEERRFREESLRRLPADSSDAEHHRRVLGGLIARLDELEEEQEQLERSVDSAFHPFWGSLFKAGPEVSSFGDQVEQYACLYTDRVSNLTRYSPIHYFRGPRDRMPHEL